MEKRSYDDIINFPRHVSKKRKPMSLYDRAAQFSPFAALTGHDAAIKETARLTDRKKELSEDEKFILDEKLKIISDLKEERNEITLTYFVPDEKKEGGSYKSVSGKLKKIDEYERLIILEGGEAVNIDDTVDIDGDIFSRFGL